MKIVCYACGREYDKGTDQRHKAILEYIKKNPNKTQSQIKIAMAKAHISSQMTTIQKLSELVEMNKIIDKKSGNGFHRYEIKK